MAINPLTVLWLEQLAQRGVFDGAGSIIEMGPQNVLSMCYETVRLVAERVAGPRAEEFVSQIFPRGRDGAPSDYSQRPLYSMLGMGSYHSIDYFDPQATFSYDLNYPISTARKYPVVTNMGTAEHCFNVAAPFETVHNLLAPGGVALHILPAMGDLDHGFYNINPMTYGRLAYANDYEVIDVRYIDHVFLRCLQVERNPQAGFDFDSLPISMADLRNRRMLVHKTAMRFVENMLSPETRELVVPNMTDVPAIVFDYCYVALRKRSDKPFVMPFQEKTQDHNWLPELAS